MRRIKSRKTPTVKRKPPSRNQMLACAAGGVYASSVKYRWRKISLRTKIYTFVIVVVFFATIQPAAFALPIDMFGIGVHHLFANITYNVERTNSTLESAFGFAQTSPYDVINYVANPNHLTAIRNAIIAMALVVATLLLMVEFFRKTINFEWSSKWENILIFLVKIIVVKQVVQNADVIMGYIYAGFNTINEAAIGGTVELLPAGNVVNYNVRPAAWREFLNDFGAGLSMIFLGRDPGALPIPQFRISHDAVRMFYPDVIFPAADSVGSFTLRRRAFELPASAAADTATIELMLLQPYFLVMHAISIIVFVIVIGRLFELTLYTIFAPLPLSTFASDVSNDVGKNFIKTYIACVLQIAVIVVMFIVFVAMQRYFASSTESFAQTTLIRFVILISFGLSIVKSGAWAKKLCGVG
jgi:hypothetical protein